MNNCQNVGDQITCYTGGKSVQSGWRVKGKPNVNPRLLCLHLLLRLLRLLFLLLPRSSLAFFLSRVNVITETTCNKVRRLRVQVYDVVSSSSSSRSSDGNSSLLDEGGSASQVPQATVELAGYGSVVWPDSRSEWLVDRAGLQWTFCCLTASTARALLCMADEEFGILMWYDIDKDNIPARDLVCLVENRNTHR